MTNATIGHNNPPEEVADAFKEVQQNIDDIFDTAKDFCDGEAIQSQKMHDALKKIHDDLHNFGKTADDLRKEEKKPHDDAGKAVQKKFKPLSDKVSLGKEACQKVLAPWRKKIADEKAAAAERARIAADEAAAEAAKAIQESAGNLEERVTAEEQLAHAKSLDKGAKRANKDATTGLGLRTIWHTEIIDSEKALDWAFGEDPKAFTELVLSMAKSAVHGGTRDIPGFKITSDKVAI